MIVNAYLYDEIVKEAVSIGLVDIPSLDELCLLLAPYKRGSIAVVSSDRTELWVHCRITEFESAKADLTEWLLYRDIKHATTAQNQEQDGDTVIVRNGDINVNQNALDFV